MGMGILWVVSGCLLIEEEDVSKIYMEIRCLKVNSLMVKSSIFVYFIC